MAIGKWNPFGTTQSPATPAPVVPDQPPIVSTADAKLFGLENFGNTCYANSVLQALYFCGPFRELLLQYPDPSVPDVPLLPPPPPAPAPLPPQSTINSRKKPQRQHSVTEPSHTRPNAPPAIPIPPSPPTLLSALRSLFLHISRNPADKGTVAPRAFIDKLKELNELFRGSMHQDAHEFLNYLLNRVVEDIEEDGRRQPTANGAGKSGEDLSTSIATLATLSTQPAASTSTAQATHFHSTIVHRLFEGVLTSETRCLTCETVSSRDESFLDLSIDIEQNSSVTACLRQFSASEMLCQKNKFFCDSCCDLQEAEKRMKIKKLPNILALHLKRFKYQEDVGKYIKLAYRVAFPLQLRLFNTVDDAEDPDRLYELFAIVVHIGTGPHHGHYVTIIKARGAWMLFDDDSVTTMKESEIPKYFGDSNSGSAYVLYYQAVDVDLPALGLKVPTPPPVVSTATDIGAATADPNEHEHAPSSPAPALPPGLTEDAEYSDKSDSPMPSTPSTQPTSLPTNHTPKPPSSLQLLDIPASVAPAAVPSSPSPPHHNHTIGGFFHTLRTTPSLRLRNGTVHGADRRSGTDSSAALLASLPPLPSSPSTRRPRTAQSTASTVETTTTSFQTHEGVASVPSSPDPGRHPFPNGTSTPTKERFPEKKSSGWFRKLSSRGDRDAAPIASRPTLGRRESETAIASHPSSFVPPPMASGSASEPPLSPTTAQHKKSSPEMSRTKREKRSSAQARLPPRPSTAGAEIGGGGGSSSLSSWSRGQGARPTSGVVAPPPLPPLPGSPIVPATGVANGTAKGLFAPPPVPQLPAKGKEKETEREKSAGMRSRPPSVHASALNPSTSTLSDPAASSTSASASDGDGETRRRSSSTNPVRMSRSGSRLSHGAQPHSHPHSHHNHPVPAPLPQSRSSPVPSSQVQSHTSFFAPSLSYGGTGGGGIGDTPVVPSHSSSSTSSAKDRDRDGKEGSAGAAAAVAVAANNWKRATKKLSFTAPMLGLGRKEKEKEKENKEQREGPPSAFGQR